MNCLDAYARGRADIRFDPRARRVVFLVKHKGVIVDAAGRALDKGVQPKWLRYAGSVWPFICGSSSTAVLVEDCASAASVSSFATGVALLGTNLNSAFVSPLKGFSEVVVALDPDATKKAVDLQRLLSYFVPARVVMLADDLKYFKPERAKEMLGITNTGG